MTCRVCEQELREPTPAGHHLERSPIESDLCLGCWFGWLDMEKFLIRATGGIWWDLTVEEAMKKFLQLAKKARP